MAFLTDLQNGLAEYVAAAGIASWDPVNPYPLDDAGWVIVRDQVPDEPDRAIAVSVRIADANVTGLSDVLVAAQFVIRGDSDPTSPNLPTGALFALLHGAERLTFGTVYVPLIWHQSGAPLGLDSNDRWSRSENYLIRTSRPSAWRPD